MLSADLDNLPDRGFSLEILQIKMNPVNQIYVATGDAEIDE